MGATNDSDAMSSIDVLIVGGGIAGVEALLGLA